MRSDDKSTVSRESDKFMLRLPEGMRDKIAKLAKDNKRSMNAEIVARLEASIADPRPGVDLTEHQQELRALVIAEVQKYMKENKG